MQRVVNILRMLNALNRNIEKSFRERRSVAQRIDAIEKKLAALVEELQQKQTREELERLLQDMKDFFARGEKVKSLPSPDQLYAMEKRLHSLTPMKKKLLMTAMALADAVVKKQDGTTPLSERLPLTADELVKMLVLLTRETAGVLNHAVAQPRTLKKQSKQTGVWRFSLFTVGLILAFGDVILALTPIGMVSLEIAKASITAGAGCMTAAAVKKDTEHRTDEP